MARFQRHLIRFQRQPPGTAITRTSLIVGGLLAGLAAASVVGLVPGAAAACAGLSGALLLIGGHRANHGAGGPRTECSTSCWTVRGMLPCLGL